MPVCISMQAHRRRVPLSPPPPKRSSDAVVPCGTTDPRRRETPESVGFGGRHMHRAKATVGALGALAMIVGSTGSSVAQSPGLEPANVVFWDFSATDSQTNALNEIIASFQ